MEIVGLVPFVPSADDEPHVGGPGQAGPAPADPS
jgi:hypothetical protein